jgi:DNA-binding MarR family transcriptional regulator
MKPHVSKDSRGLVHTANEIDQHLREVRQILRRPVEAEFSRGGLTGPQRVVMHAVVGSHGVSLKKICRQVGLAHSTVSGIVDRLEKRGLVERQVDERDRRCSVIVASKAVRGFMRDTLPALIIHPLVDALRHARPAERKAIVEGLRTLRRVVEAAST